LPPLPAARALGNRAKPSDIPTSLRGIQHKRAAFGTGWHTSGIARHVESLSADPSAGTPLAILTTQGFFMLLAHRSLFVWSSLLAAAALSCRDDLSDGSVARTIDPTHEDIRAAIHSNLGLTNQLAGAVAQQSGNVIYSPLSIEAVAGMLYAGADSATADQLGLVLGASAEPPLIHAGIGALLQDLAENHGNTIALANRLFVAPTQSLLPDFSALMHDVYRAPAQPLSFSDPESARMTIDRWVAEQTQNKIPELFMPGTLDPLTSVVAVDALYFKAAWARAFAKSDTQDAPFQRLDGTQVQVPMMQLTAASVRTGTFENGIMVDLPYRSGDLSFLAILPATVQSLPALEQALATADLPGLIADMTATEVNLQLPRFSLRTQLDLVPLFQALGVGDLFDQAHADLSRVDGMRDLYVSRFVHEAWVSVDEEGTVAAAATAAKLTQHSVLSIQFDRPFLFVIRDELTGAVLFAGRVVDPTQT
jgi:serine protease inhibitor